MRAAALDVQGYVTNLIEVAPRDVPAGAQLIPDGVPVGIGWRYAAGRWSAPDAPTPPPPPPQRDLDAEYAARADKATTLAGLRAVVRDYLTERSAAS